MKALSARLPGWSPPPAKGSWHQKGHIGKSREAVLSNGLLPWTTPMGALKSSFESIWFSITMKLSC